MEYNTARTHLVMPEYGRNVQGMAEYLLTIEDRERCLRNAEAVIDLMAILSPQLKLVEDYRHMLWDHLHLMTGFKLDVDAPYPKPTPEEIYKKPAPLPYPQVAIKHRHLGHNLDAFLQKGLDEQDAEKKQAFTQHIGYYMKLAYANWHKEPVHDDMIKAELAQLSGGSLQYEPGGFKVHVDTRINGGNSFGKKKNFTKSAANNNRNFNNASSPNNIPVTPASGNSYNKNRKFNNNNKSKPRPQQP